MWGFFFSQQSSIFENPEIIHFQKFSSKRFIAIIRRKSQGMSVPKNTLIEKALRIYLEQLNRAAYVKSYKHNAADKDTLM
jgi:hypothetical protein